MVVQICIYVSFKWMNMSIVLDIFSLSSLTFLQDLRDHDFNI
jgi:hypothetical protein